MIPQHGKGSTDWGTPEDCTKDVRTVGAGASPDVLHTACLREEAVYVLLCCRKRKVADIHLQIVERQIRHVGL